MKHNRVAVLGGSGFIGRYVVRRAGGARGAAGRGQIARRRARQVSAADGRSGAGRAGQCRDRQRGGVAGVSSKSSDAVINKVVGILRQERAAAFRRRPSRRAESARADGAPIGDRAVYPYLRARRRPPRALDLRARRQQARLQRAGRSRRLPDRDHPAPVGHLRARGPVLQQIRGDGAGLAGAAVDRRRRDAVPAGPCRRCRERRAGLSRRPRDRGAYLRVGRATPGSMDLQGADGIAFARRKECTGSAS